MNLANYAKLNWSKCKNVEISIIWMRFGMGNRNCKIWFESSTGAAKLNELLAIFFSLWQQKQTLQTDTLLNLLADAFQQIKSNIIIHMDLLCCASGHLIDVLNAMSDLLAAECFTFALLLSAGLWVFTVFQSFVLVFWGGFLSGHNSVKEWE